MKATKRWSYLEIVPAFAAIAELADEYGYLAALFGSTVKAGDGRDLDVLMLSRFQQRNDWRGFLAAFGGDIVKQFHREDRGNHSYEVLKGERLYHFCFGRF